MNLRISGVLAIAVFAVSCLLCSAQTFAQSIVGIWSAPHSSYDQMTGASFATFYPSGTFEKILQNNRRCFTLRSGGCQVKHFRTITASPEK